MNKNQPTIDNTKPDTNEVKPSFFTRIFNKMDTAMKSKADEAAKNPCCSNDKDGKGGKCC